MNKELILELNEIRKELEISEEDFVTIMALAEERRNNSSIFISDEMLYEIILGALMDYDYEEVDDIDSEKQAMEALRILLLDTDKVDHFTQEELEDMANEYSDYKVDQIEGIKPRKRKTLSETVDQSIRSLGL